MNSPAGRGAKRATSRRRSAPLEEDHGRFFPLLQVMIGALLAARLLTPTEGAVLGETLIYTQLYLTVPR